MPLPSDAQSSRAGLAWGRSERLARCEVALGRHGGRLAAGGDDFPGLRQLPTERHSRVVEASITLHYTAVVNGLSWGWRRCWCGACCAPAGPR
jgi:hypothetical protein